MKTIILYLSMFYSAVAMGAPSEKPPVGMSKEIWDKHLERQAKAEKDRQDRFQKELKDNPPEPPWVRYPEYHSNDIFWRMGEGETYLMEYVLPYLKYASEVELKSYKEKYPEPKSWHGWYAE
ncbi:hypothetical protein M0G74_10570 [Microbulbifer sp. CAU 1566]|uniref:hypothetical protein n=1 Tax=Microbulbifer sp. CAU 1566 TaxID=2933269 RepID=UPI00200299B4|nr:hypothetical protein [Microbulbifer sp. CAU 1566]MCK7597712.1 hypothetical protein [Microbulbifer sp. CAU 1566]